MKINLGGELERGVVCWSDNDCRGFGMQESDVECRVL